MAKGKFIVIDGPDGSGKSNAVKALQTHFRTNKKLLFTREPGGTEAGREIRSFLMSEESAAITAEQEIILFCADRIIHLVKEIRPALDVGTSVICDRFSTSTLAYEIFGRGRHDLMPFFKMINLLTVGTTIPDHIIILDVSPKVGLERREKSAEGKCTRYDRAALSYHEKVRKGFAKNNTLATSWHLIDTDTLTEKEVHRKVIEIVKSIL